MLSGFRAYVASGFDGLGFRGFGLGLAFRKKGHTARAAVDHLHHY